MILAKKVRIYPTKEQEQKLWQSVGTARFIYNYTLAKQEENPTKEQEQKLWQSVGTARFIYNYTLAKQEENYKNGGKFINDGVIRKE